VIAVNRTVDRAFAEKLHEQFSRGALRARLDDAALELLTRSRTSACSRTTSAACRWVGERDVRQVLGGLLVQDRDADLVERAEMEVVTARAPTEAEWGELLFAWKVCKHVKSNAIVLSKDLATAGIGAGQMSRVDSVRLALEKSRLASLNGATLASDAFFPFSDGPELAMEAGVTAIIQPGGSVRDDEVIAAVDAADAAMVFTHRRHFRH
jgi:phosphoribosylaminoimidazolecarboxamide formyltransferase/IMP cyclohydrolase